MEPVIQFGNNKIVNCHSCEEPFKIIFQSENLKGKMINSEEEFNISGENNNFDRFFCRKCESNNYYIISNNRMVLCSPNSQVMYLQNRF